MKILKKAGVILVLFLAVVMLTGCQESGPDTNIVTMKGDTVTVTDLYEESKVFPNSSTVSLLQNLTFGRIFEKEFGEQVTEEDVTARFDELKQGMSEENFTSFLQEQGMTEESYKINLRLQLLQQKALNKEIEASQFTEDNLRDVWESYYPEVSTYIASADSQENADRTREFALSDADGFRTEAEEKDLALKFDSTTTRIPTEVQTAAFELQDGQVSEVIPIENEETGETHYFIIYMIANPGKGDDMNEYKTQLENSIRTQKEGDEDFVIAVFKEYLTEHNVIVKETAFGNIFSNFMGIAVD